MVRYKFLFDETNCIIFVILSNKHNIMDTIVLKYDARNPIAMKTLDYILSLGFFEKTEYYNPFAESDDDIRNGRIFTAKDADDLINECLK